MSSADIMQSARAAPTWVWLAVSVVVLVVLALAARLVRRIRRDRLADAVATTIGLGWTSEGMWETATRRYDVVPQLALVLFVLFESLMVAQMIRAYRYRTDLPRRARFVRAVWTIAVVMGFVVALAEGWVQAPLRLSVPLLVAYTWWLGLTADDDPADRLDTSWRWTPRELGIRLGILRAGRSDARQIDRDHLIERMRALSFAQRWGWSWAGDLTRRRIRLAKLAMVADDDVRERVRASIAAAAAVMVDAPLPVAPTLADAAPAEPEREPDPVAPPTRPEPVEIRIESPTGWPQGVHCRDRVWRRGTDLRDDAIAQLLASVDADHPTGMTNAELSALYTPPLKSRLAETYGAAARARINGRVPA